MSNDLRWSLTSTAQSYVNTASTVPATVDGSTIIESGTIHAGSFGTIGHGDFSFANVTAQGTRFLPFQNALPQYLRDGPVLLQVAWGNTPLFTGLYDTTESQLGSGGFKTSARDYGALLQERYIAPWIADKNQTVGSFISRVLNEAPFVQVGPTTTPTDGSTPFGAATGLPRNFIGTPLNLNGTPILMGTFYAEGTQFFSRPEAAWGVSQRLARDCGYVAYFLPDGSFYFGPRNRQATFKFNNDQTQTLPARQLKWSAGGSSDFVHNGLTIHHNAGRNAAFVVVVYSSTKNSPQPIIGTAAYINPQLSSSAYNTIGNRDTGMIVGLGLEALDDLYGKLPRYEHYISGLQMDQANLRALSLALEIAAQEITLVARLPGPTSLEVGQLFTVSGANEYLLGGQEFVVVHSTLMTDARRGFINELTAWKIDEPQVFNTTAST